MAARGQCGAVARQPGPARADPPDRHRRGLAGGAAGVARGLGLRALGRGARAALSRPAGHRRRLPTGRSTSSTGWSPSSAGPRRPARWARSAPSASVPWEMPEFGLDDDALDLLPRRPGGARALPRPAGAVAGRRPAQVRHFLRQRRAALDRRTARSWATGAWPATSAPTCWRARRCWPPSRATGAVHAHPDAAGAAPRTGACSMPTRRRCDMFGFADLQAMVGQDLLTVYRRRRLARARAPAPRGAAADERRRERCRWPTSGSPRRDGRRIVVRATGVRAGHAGRPGDAVDLRRRHRAPERPRTRCAAPRRCCRTWSPPART